MAEVTFNAQKEYYTWYDFKRDLECQLGRFVNVNLWQHTKPQKPLPWNTDDLQSTLSEILKIQRSLGGDLNRFRAS